MLEAEAFNDRGLVRLSGIMPNGPATFTRIVEGMPTYPLRGGDLTISAGAVMLEDSEAPIGLPVTYRGQVTTTERLIQTNYVRTPTFLHGVQGWLAGTGRTLTTVTDADSHSGTVGFVTDYTPATSVTAPPTYIGQISTPINQAGTYTLTPPTGGGTPVATNDWMLLAHNQLSTATAPTISAGWTQIYDRTDRNIRLTVWARKRVGTDTGYTVTVGAGAASVGTLLWVRGMIDERWLSNLYANAGDGGNYITVGPTCTLRPSLAVSIVAAETEDAAVLPVADDVTGATWKSAAGPTGATDTRSLVIAAGSNAAAGYSEQATVRYLETTTLVSGLGFQVAFQSNNQVTERIIAREPVALLPGAELPYLLTGRFKFVSAGLRTWQNVKDTYATWQAAKNANATWLALRGSAAVVGDGYLQLFVTINNPSTGVDLIQPQLAIGAPDVKLNTWIDFSILFTTPVDIPAGSEIHFVHGVSANEYHIQWYFDEIGITSGVDRQHDTLYWFDGDTPTPPNPQNFMREGEWEDLSQDTAIAWSGTVGNSASTFTGPSVVANSVQTQLGLPDGYPTEPILLSDPVDSALATWVGLLPYDDLTYPARTTLHTIIDRADPLATNQVRGMESGTLNFLTRTTSEREALLSVFASGRVLLLRTPYREYPENDWYLSFGDLKETRPLPNQRELLRFWSVPFSRILRPAGLINVSTAATWQDVKDLGTWQDVKGERANWLQVLLTLPGTDE